MKRSFSSVLFLTALLIILSDLCGSSANFTYAADSIDLSGKWEISETGGGNIISSFSDDSAVSDIGIPGSWLGVLKKNDNLSAAVWIRKKIFIGRDKMMKQPVLFIERISVADEAYFNGVKIGSSGIIPKHPGDLHYQISWLAPRVYFIPDNLIRYDSDNAVALRIYSHIQSGVTGEILIYDYYENYFERVVKCYKPLFVSIGAVMLNLILILIFTLLFISGRSKTEYLYFTLVIVCTLLCSFLSFPLPVMIEGLWRYKLFVFFYSMANFFVFLGVKKFLGLQNSTLKFAVMGFLVLVETAVLLAPTSEFLVFYCGIACLIFVNVCILSSSAMFIYAIRRDPRRYWYFLILAIPVPISVLRNSYFIFFYRFNELPLVIFLHVPLVFLFISLYYIYNFEKSRKEKEILYTALLRKSKNDLRILKSLKDKNKKPEPRDLITNVIEYLDVNYAEKYDRIELSKQFGLNEDYMGQIFRKATGTNISNYININRINAAKELLADTGAKIIDIAYHVGFDNLTYFHRQFKMQAGCTPNEYRKNLTRN